MLLSTYATTARYATDKIKASFCSKSNGVIEEGMDVLQGCFSENLIIVADAKILQFRDRNVI